MPPLGLIVLPVVLQALALWVKCSQAGSGGGGDDGQEAGGHGELARGPTVGSVLPWMLIAHGISLGTFFGHVYVGGDLGLTLGTTTVLAFSLPLVASRYAVDINHRLIDCSLRSLVHCLLHCL